MMNTTTTAARLGNIYRARLAARAAARISIAETLEAAEKATARRANSARLAAIARAASAEYRAWIARYPQDAGRACWIAAIRNAAADAHAEKALDDLTPADIRAALDGDDAAQARTVDALRHIAARMPGYAQRQTLRLAPEAAAARLGELDGDDAARLEEAAENGDKLRILAPSTAAAWMGTREPWHDSIDHITAEAWTRLPTALEAVENSGKHYHRPASSILYRAAWGACRAIDVEYSPHKRSRRTPEERARLELRMIGSRPQDPESGAIAADIVHRAAVTPEELYILRMIAAGVTQTEIAARLGRKQYQISRTLDRIRAAAQKMLTESLADELDAAVFAAAGIRYRPRPVIRQDNASTAPGTSYTTSSPAAHLYRHSLPAD